MGEQEKGCGQVCPVPFSELAGMIGSEKGESGGGTVPSFGEGLDLTDCRWSQSDSEAFLQARAFSAFGNAVVAICGSRFH